MLRHRHAAGCAAAAPGAARTCMLSAPPISRRATVAVVSGRGLGGRNSDAGVPRDSAEASAQGRRL